MEILNKKIHPLRHGNLFAEIEVRGKREEKFKLSEVELEGQVLFYSEFPKSKINCTNNSDGTIELGGSAEEGIREIYLVIGRIEGKNEEGRTASAERN